MHRRHIAVIVVVVLRVFSAYVRRCAFLIHRRVTLMISFTFWSICGVTSVILILFFFLRFHFLLFAFLLQQIRV